MPIPYACNFHKIWCGFAQKLVLNAKFSKNFDWQKFTAVVFREIRSVFDTGKNLASILQASLRERGANILQQASFADYTWLAGCIAALYRGNSASVWYWPEFWPAICKRLCRKSVQIRFATLYGQIFPFSTPGGEWAFLHESGTHWASFIFSASWQKVLLQDLERKLQNFRKFARILSSLERIMESTLT